MHGIFYNIALLTDMRRRQVLSKSLFIVDSTILQNYLLHLSLNRKIAFYRFLTQTAEETNFLFLPYTVNRTEGCHH